MAAAEPQNQARSEDPYRAYSFKLIIQNATEGHFLGCSGLGVRVDPIQYREAGDPDTIRQIPGIKRHSEVTLSYGVTRSRTLFDWMMSTGRGEVDRRNVSICVMASDGTRELTRWNLYDAWPSEWNGAPLDVMKSELAIESVSLCFERMDRDGGVQTA